MLSRYSRIVNAPRQAPGRSAVTEYRIDELARAAGTTVRNIRAYQDRGLLHPPRVLGRVGMYSEQHLRRLRRVLSLLNRGYASAQIQELLGAWERGVGLSGVIDLEQAITRSWRDEVPVVMSHDEAVELLGSEDHLERVMASGWAVADDDRVTFLSQALLDTFQEAVALGWPAEKIIDLQVRLTPALDHVADLFVDTAVEHLVAEHGDAWVPRGDEVAQTAALIERLRELASTSIGVVLARALETSVERAYGEHQARIQGQDDSTP
ncbi:MAG: MerR family transcriptional regulator [Actinomycetales bacterium]|nr:MAG: MerR family transcriptional regulator [Actinomycetales bacterium]